MAPKGKNVGIGVGSKRNRRGSSAGASSWAPIGLTPKKSVNRRWNIFGKIGGNELRIQLEIEEEVHDLCVPRAPHLVCHLVDATKTKAQDISHWPVLLTADHQERDDSWIR
ncbi:hypothetical protein H5410_041205 [Solanum commersonii]|uniref:Uncharacterized protein n=1 Tax=Solanum commersonii TaxID=4109 RepID=A0A9J5XQX2_SOLCO|nr:hypothetical protein H5410_041205 [Solanum commersonii]